jgi:hypothetical protein
VSYAYGDPDFDGEGVPHNPEYTRNPLVTRRESVKSFKVGVKTNGDCDWVSNMRRYATREEAQAAAESLFMRWTAVKEFTVLESDDEPNVPSGRKEPDVRKTKAQKQADARIQNSVNGFVIPMLSIPKLYRALEAAVAEGGSDDDLKAVVAAFPGVMPSGPTGYQRAYQHYRETARADLFQEQAAREYATSHANEF